MRILLSFRSIFITRSLIRGCLLFFLVVSITETIPQLSLNSYPANENKRKTFSRGPDRPGGFGWATWAWGNDPCGRPEWHGSRPIPVGHCDVYPGPAPDRRGIRAT